MYESHWKLSERPFENRNDSKYYYPAETHQAALLKLHYAIENRRAAALLCGPGGMGKSLLVETLKRQLNETYRPISHVVFPAMNAVQMIRYLVAQVGVGGLGGISSGDVEGREPVGAQDAERGEPVSAHDAERRATFNSYDAERRATLGPPSQDVAADVLAFETFFAAEFGAATPRSGCGRRSSSARTTRLARTAAFTAQFGRDRISGGIRLDSGARGTAHVVVTR